MFLLPKDARWFLRVAKSVQQRECMSFSFDRSTKTIRQYDQLSYDFTENSIDVSVSGCPEDPQYTIFYLQGLGYIEKLKINGAFYWVTPTGWRYHRKAALDITCVAFQSVLVPIAVSVIAAFVISLF